MSKKTKKPETVKVRIAKLSPAAAALVTASQNAKEIEVMEHFKHLLSQPLVDTVTIQNYFDEVYDGANFTQEITLVIKKDGTINPVCLPTKFREIYNEVEAIINLEKEEFIAELTAKERPTEADILRLVDLELANNFKSRFKKTVTT